MMEAVGISALFVAFPRTLAFFLTAVAPGFRPAPGRQPPLRPLTPTMPVGRMS